METLILLFIAIPAALLSFGLAGALILFKYGKKPFICACIMQSIVSIPLIYYFLLGSKDWYIGESVFISIALTFVLFLPIYLMRSKDKKSWSNGVLVGWASSYISLPVLIFFTTFAGV